MPNTVEVPGDFSAVVVTLPADMGAGGITQLQQLTSDAKLDKFAGHRVLHLHQVTHLDSSGIAALVAMVERVRAGGFEVAICEPPPIVLSYLDIYRTKGLLDGALLSSDSEGMYESALVPFVPPFVPEPRGRIDQYSEGRAQSWIFGPDGLEPVPPPDLQRHPPKVPARAEVMAVRKGPELHELRAGAFVWIRRHMCGCTHEHTAFEALHKLHQWYRGKAFDFVALELWASDLPAGIVTEKLTFRDRSHYGQFETLLKVDTAWRDMGQTGHPLQDEYYYLYT